MNHPVGCPLGSNAVRTEKLVERFIVDEVHKTGNWWRQRTFNLEHPFSLSIIDGVRKVQSEQGVVIACSDVYDVPNGVRD